MTESASVTPSVTPAPPDLPITGSSGLPLLIGLVVLIVGIGAVLAVRRRP